LPKKRIISLNHELMIIASIALAAALISYFILSTVFNALLAKHFETEVYYRQQDQKMLQDLNAYISEFDVSTTDWYELNQWTTRSNLAQLIVYKDELLAYDSELYKSEESIAEANTVAQIQSDYEKEISYKVEFADGEADVIIYGVYATFYYRLAFAMELLIPCILFVVILLTSVSSKVKYIVRLSDEIHIMEGGDLEYPVTVRGRDELTLLAVSLDELRVSFTNKLDEITKLQQDSKSLVTEMSHDMRTPMTPLLVYLGMLREKRYSTEEELMNYINKSYEKAAQLKHMSDNMFSYFLMDKEITHLNETLSMNTVFYDQLSAMSDYMTASGFTIKADIQISEVNINVNMDSIARIFDNLVSNIMKYADINSPVFIKLYSENGKVILHIGNLISADADYSASTGFGVKNIKKMMAQMDAECIISQKPISYDTFLLFKIVSVSAEAEAELDLM